MTTPIFDLMKTTLDMIDKALVSTPTRDPWPIPKELTPKVSYPCDCCRTKEVEHNLSYNYQDTCDLCNDCYEAYQNGYIDLP